MNTNYGKSGKSVSLNNNEFDFGFGTNRSRPLNDQRSNQTSSYSSSSGPFTQTKPNKAPSWQPNKPSWTHQPAVPSQSGLPGSLGGGTSMVGDILGKSWASSSPSTTVASSVGIANKNPNLFGDLVGSAFGQSKGNNNVPLKNAAPTSYKSAYSMGGMTDSLPKTATSVKSSGGSLGSTGNFGSYMSAPNNNSNAKSKNANPGGASMHNLSGSGVGMSSNKDPFGSLVDFGSKPGASIKSEIRGNSQNNLGSDGFGDFQNSSKQSVSSFQSSAFPPNNSYSMGSNTGSFPDVENFGIPTSKNQPTVQSSGFNDFDSLFSSSSASRSPTAKSSGGVGIQQFSEGDDWGFNSEFGGGNDAGGTTELEGLPPPPSGVTASAAMSKGMDNHKQGQYADAIKWLSWSVILMEKAGDDTGIMDVLSSRASCYKEVGEYKKAVADCTKVLEQDGKNVSVLVQRALLYESMEKYKLGAEDLRTVMNIDPGNRVARSTIHRLNKMAAQ